MLTRSKTAKSKGKSRRRQAGRKGTVDEWDYLVQSLGRLIVRVDEKSAEAIPLLRFLITAGTDDLSELAKDLQDKILGMRSKLAAALDEAWRDRAAVLRDADESGGMGFQGDTTLAKELARPEVEGWKGLGPLIG